MAKKAADSEARQRILEVADVLFFEVGIRVSGVDTLVARSGVAKTTLYRHFPSKDDLVVAYLQDRDRRYREYLQAVLGGGLDAAHKLYALMARLEQLINQPDTHGCPFLLAAGEFPDLHHPAHQVAIEHKARMKKTLLTLAQAAQAQGAESLAGGLMLLIDGAFSERRLLGAAGPPIALVEPSSQILRACGMDL